jgi:hypothetical protein
MRRAAAMPSSIARSANTYEKRPCSPRELEVREARRGSLRVPTSARSQVEDGYAIGARVEKRSR